ncbi:MAG TPA: cell division protein ZapE [Pseudomonas sp.]|uniref:cell division protein ZapE n=1 Tax=Stutzerimonas frequens TaxID=2968969 RepID=UPI0007B7FE7E|nr:cell division protein ZapE [Stutzerimonas frequens]MBA4724687.1 AFG1 family ATPase [Pseudomonas sp.]NCT78756.1 cell division protein ZapE [Stutzerimonas stutzeri]KZX63167.1 ATPase [Stutzerimonas frequens]MBK3756920.1 cell division protein ZapE [Stutzerimonas frequens]MBK3916995.1 cell division protein ZapE [Stutzerimonas frequens]
MHADSPRERYQQAIAQEGFVADAAQQRAVARLQACHEALLSGADLPLGVYLWGPVGRGKTWLMDLFHASLTVPSRRQHFHHFMRWVHIRLFQLNGTADPLQALARELSQEIRVLCFDELFVGDIGDAIILGRLFQVLFEHGVVIVATSNQPPEQLYADGFNRERFLPAIDAIVQHMQVVDVDGGADHRLRPGAALQRYWIAPFDGATALAATFEALADGAVSTEPLALSRRQLDVVRRSESVLWCRFADLCEQPFSALDFIELCDRFTAILIGAVPRLGGTQRDGRIARGTEDGAARVEAGDRQLPRLAARDDAVRRFIALVDECYDRRIPLYIEAEVALDELYTEGYLAFPFRRTLSRLREMQLQRFG